MDGLKNDPCWGEAAILRYTRPLVAQPCRRKLTLRQVRSESCRPGIWAKSRLALSASQSADRGVAHSVAPGDGSEALAAGEAALCLGLLVFIELRPAPEPPAPGLRGGPALVGALGDALALVLGDRRQEGEQALAMVLVRSRCGLWRTLTNAPRASTRSMIAMPSIIDLVARSHSATTNTSPVPRASMAFSSCGRSLSDLPDIFSAKITSQRSARSAPSWRSRFLGRGADPRVADLAHFAPRISCLNCWPAGT
jgi:hypothetical protein